MLPLERAILSYALTSNPFFFAHAPNCRPSRTASGNSNIAAVKLMRTRIGLLAQPKSMRSIIDATRREQQHGLAWNWCVNRDGVPAVPHTQHNFTPSPCCAFSGAEVAEREEWGGLVIVWTQCDRMHLRLFFGDLALINHLLEHFFRRGFQRTVRHS